ncbi:MAG: hypothetical protein KKA73_19315 [Chloroflexi bacterium]|nr:hypothetical protein [Chloroflexota bacterium]MBU1749839.1 hypothetical protein [Chloroflexota bacterium]
MTIADLLLELDEALSRSWFVQQIGELDRTDDAIKVRLTISAGLFVQLFLSETTGRVSLALIQGGDRIYGRDCEGGQWHRHSYGAAETHEVTPEGVSAHPVSQFLAEVEELLVENDLL